MAVCLGDRLCMSRKGGTGEVGGFTCRVKQAWLPLLTCRKALVGTRRGVKGFASGCKSHT